MDTPISRVGIARSPTKASRCRVLDGSSVIRHRRDPGLQTAIISNTKAMASTRIQLMTNGYAHVGAGVGDRYDRAALFLNPNTHDAGTGALT